MKPLTDADHARRLRLYNAGHSDRAIARTVGVSGVAIFKWRARHKLAANKPDLTPITEEPTVSHIHDHIRAFRALGRALANRAEQMGDPTGLLTCIADAHHDAADQLEAEEKADATAVADSHRCTIDHRALTVPKCPACGGAKL